MLQPLASGTSAGCAWRGRLLSNRGAVAPPEISAPIKLKEIAAAVGVGGTMRCMPRIVLAESEMKTTLRDVLSPSTSEAVLAIGPEGGWADDELAWFRDVGMDRGVAWTTPFLRAETAAIVAAALAIDFLR